MNLTDEQRSFVDFAEERILDNTQVLEFINTSSGTGNTYILNTFKAKMLLKKKQVACCAFTGIAAILLLDGCNFHSHFNASRYLDVERGLKINKNTTLASYLLKTEVLVNR